MEFIIGLVAIFIVIGIICSVFSWLADLVGGTINLVIIVAIFAIAFFAFSWVGVFCVIAIALLGFGIVVVGAMLDEHDKRAKEVAEEQHKMQSEKIIHSNDSVLMKELETGCMYLGYMKKSGRKNFRISEIVNIQPVFRKLHRILQNRLNFKTFGRMTIGLSRTSCMYWITRQDRQLQKCWQKLTAQYLK